MHSLIICQCLLSRNIRRLQGERTYTCVCVCVCGRGGEEGGEGRIDNTMEYWNVNNNDNLMCSQDKTAAWTICAVYYLSLEFRK